MNEFRTKLKEFMKIRFFAFLKFCSKFKIAEIQKKIFFFCSRFVLFKSICRNY